MSNYPQAGPDGTIPVDDALTYAQNWNDYLTASDQGFKVRSFNIPIIDFKNILKYNPTAESVNAYIGLKVANDPTSSLLILVPVVDGHNVVVVPADADLGLGDENQSNTYDMTRPCPPTCPVGGPFDPPYGSV